MGGVTGPQNPINPFNKLSVVKPAGTPPPAPPGGEAAAPPAVVVTNPTAPPPAPPEPPPTPPPNEDIFVADKTKEQTAPNPQKPQGPPPPPQPPSPPPPVKPLLDKLAREQRLTTQQLGQAVELAEQAITTNFINNPITTATAFVAAQIASTILTPEEDKRKTKSSTTDGSTTTRSAPPRPDDTPLAIFTAEVREIGDRFRDTIATVTRTLFNEGSQLANREDVALSAAERRTIAAAALVSAAATTAGTTAAALTPLAQGVATYVQRTFPDLPEDVLAAATNVMLAEVFNAPITNPTSTTNRGGILA